MIAGLPPTAALHAAGRSQLVGLQVGVLLGRRHAGLAAEEAFTVGSWRSDRHGHTTTRLGAALRWRRGLRHLRITADDRAEAAGSSAAASATSLAQGRDDAEVRRDQEAAERRWAA